MAIKRFIPAHAGNTRNRHRRQLVESVHPRACGEHCLCGDNDRSSGGSSPRMRGTPRIADLDRDRRRFIPAHAGNTTIAFTVLSTGEVHPRACGEHRNGYSFTLEQDGSSPRMRGTRGGYSTSDERRRFIPAHAGNTVCAETTTGAAAVHPRACGEHIRAVANLIRPRGSSPRMRGTRTPSRPEGCRSRFIPAHAGNTRARTPSSSARPVHPRACGEHGVRVEPGAGLHGSSPRMRGTPAWRSAATPWPRFIPAHAGNTDRRGVGRTRTAVHPRACGEHNRPSTTPRRISGSSPRMRGTRRLERPC